MARITIATCVDVPAHAIEDDHALVAELTARGHETSLVPWDSPDHDWATDDASVIRSTWDYWPRRAEYVAWAHSVPRLLNPAQVIDWNTDKVYLEQLAAAGVPIIPTTWLRAGDEVVLPATGNFVVKPSVSAGAQDTLVHTQDALDAAAAHIANLTSTGRTAMVQPYVSGIDVQGETALLFMNGDLSHAMRKGAILRVGAASLTAATYREEMELREPTAAQLALADQVLALVPGGRESLLYARVDLVPADDGSPMLIELEVTEPSLFLSYSEGAVERLASAIEARLA